MNTRSVSLFRSAWPAIVVSVPILGGVFAAPAGAQAPRTTDRVLVRFRPGVAAARVQDAFGALGVRPLRQIGRLGIVVAAVPAGADSRLVARALARRADVLFAEPDLLLAPTATPNDAQYGSQWHLPKISAPAAWDKTTGSASVTVAILDSGVEPTHPDLKDKIVPGWNFTDNNSNTADVFGHGTFVAGTAAASSNNTAGVAAPAWSCRLMPVRVTDTNGYASISALASGLQWAADHGARVANMSFNVLGYSSVSSAAKYFQDKGGVVVASAGNDGVTQSAADDPVILTIGATTSSDAIASWSNRGAAIDLVAPGSMIYTTCKNGTYGYVSGTSLAAPVVAGAAALVLSANPSLSGAQALQVLRDATDDLGAAGWDSTFGTGRLNVSKAVDRALATPGGADTTAPSVQWTSPAAGATVAGTVTLTASASDNVGVTQVVFSVNGSVVATDTTAPFSVSWDSTRVADGAATLRAEARDAAGNASAASIAVTVANADATPPTIRITSPTDGATVRGTVSVLVDARDNVAVTRVELYVDGVLTSTSTTAPFTTTWNTRKATAGSHVLQTRAYDARNNAALSQQVTVIR